MMVMVMAKDNKKITAEDVERMCQLYDELGTYKAVAEKMKISASTVSKYIKESGHVRSTEQVVGKTKTTNTTNNNAAGALIKGNILLILFITAWFCFGAIIDAATESIFWGVVLGFVLACIAAMVIYYLSVLWSNFKAESKEIRKRGRKIIIRTSLITLLIICGTITLFTFFGGNSGNSSDSEPGHCIICDKKATNTFQGSEYCKKHYDKAVKWAIDNLDDD